jgi:hypothetical protein
LQSFWQWFQQHVSPEEPWLMLGKGPTFALVHQLDVKGYRTLSLNHVAREGPVQAAHVIDFKVIEDCGEAIERNAGVLVMPWYPHVGNKVGTRSLAQLTQEDSTLGRLSASGRLLWYDLSTSPVRYGPGPVVEATYFSAEAALNLLVLAGVRRVRSLGIDGGSTYSGAFEDLRDSTLLANGRSSFDLQFEGFARTIVRSGVDFSPLDLPSPARVLSAYTPGEALPVAVLHHSIRRRASLTVLPTALPDGSNVGVPEGKTIVLPPWAQVLADVRKLWGIPLQDLDLIVPVDPPVGHGAALAIAGRGLLELLPTLASSIRAGAPLKAPAGGLHIRRSLPQEWGPGRAAGSGVDGLVLYYPPDGSEPWLSRGHPLGHLWVRDLLDAVAQGHVSPEVVAAQVAMGHVRPSLLYQVEHGLEEPLLLPARARHLDRDFPPAQQKTHRSLAVQWRPMLGALGRQVGRWTRELKAGVAAPR